VRKSLVVQERAGCRFTSDATLDLSYDCGPRPDGLPRPPGLGYERLRGTTFSARGPFGPWPMLKVTLSPSRMESNAYLVHADW